MMKFKTIFIALSLVVSQSVLASNAQEVPNACPTVKAIQAEGVNHVVRESDRGGLIALGSDNRYDTNVVWKFGILLSGFYDDEQEYLKLSNEAVKALDSNVFGPEKAEDGHWACFYVKEGVLGQAISPPDEPTLKQYISRHKK